jgi:hypothetical protein
MKPDRFEKLIAFLERLKRAKIPHTLNDNRDEAVSVLVFSPHGYWEVDFLADGDVDVERFRSNGQIDDESTLEELFALWADNESATVTPVSRDDASARE